MKLRDVPTTLTLDLPNDLLWSDEFDWTAAISRQEYTLSGALVVEVSARQAGRPITLKPPQDDMAWITRATLVQLYSWAATPGKALQLLLEYPSDTRTFDVMFRTDEDAPIEAKPVKQFPQHDGSDWFLATLKLQEI